MILTIFLLFLCLAVVFMVVGYYIKNELILIFGLLILLFLSFPLINQELIYKSGHLENTSYVYNNESLELTESITSYSYNSYTDTIYYGIFFIFSSISGMFYLYNGYRKERKRRKDEGDY
jgi:O-antigen/teichoic acid export membrane protein